MDNLLDLCIALDTPPQGSSPEAVASIRLSCDLLGFPPLGQGDVLVDPLKPKERENLHWYLEEYWKWPYEQFLERGKKIEEQLPVLGKRLYQSIFGSIGARDILQAWRLYPEMPGLQRRISIISGISKALSLPWELLHDEQGFLVLRSRHPVSLVRRLPQAELSGFPTPFQPPLRILLITARPVDVGFVDPRSIAHELLDEVQNQVDTGSIALEFLRPPTLMNLRKRLNDDAQPPVHVLHFDGHGVFGEGRDKQGGLVFEYEDGAGHLVVAEDLAQVLQKSGVRLVVLTACQSAQGSEGDVFSSVAARLIGSGIDAVAAMSASILVVSAARFAEAFYRALAGGISVPVAQERARQALHDEPRRHIHHRRMNEEGSFVFLRDWWLPHYYQQRPILLQPKKTSRKGRKAAGPPLPRLSEGLPAAPRYGFSGRAYELLQIERALLNKKLVVLHGFGGIGKTALAREAAEWFTRTHLFEGACFVSFEHGGDAEMLLSALGRYLGVYDAHYAPFETQVALTQLEPVLAQRRVLIIADNLESILPNGEAPLEATARTRLWDVLLELANKGAGLLLTSRDPAFGEGRLAPGSRTMFLLLRGLHPDDAYTLASRLLIDLQIDRTRAPYAELREMLAQLDYHPLSIQLVLRALQDHSLSSIKAEMSELLPIFLDDTATGRNRSLLASLEYSLRRLGEDNRLLVRCLEHFEGGAYEELFLEVTLIREEVWAAFRPALEQAALVVAEQDVAVDKTFLHFHPVLVPYLRGLPLSSVPVHFADAFDPEFELATLFSLQPGDELALLLAFQHARFVQTYHDLARTVQQEDTQHPQWSRIIVQRELPNLLRLFSINLDHNFQEHAVPVGATLAHFLSVFGRMRERDRILQQMMNITPGEFDSLEPELTNAEYESEIAMAQAEDEAGKHHAAQARLRDLIGRIETQPEGRVIGRRSFSHCHALAKLAHSFSNDGQLAAAEAQLHEALTIIDDLIEQPPGDDSISNNDYLDMRASLIGLSGDILRRQGLYDRSKQMNEEALRIYIATQNHYSQGVQFEKLGTLAMLQQNYSEAQEYYEKASMFARILGERAAQAAMSYMLGRLAEEQEQWDQAEHHFRDSLALREELGDQAGVAVTCNQLGTIALKTDRYSEAEGWVNGALQRIEQIEAGGFHHGTYLSNLARILVRGIKKGQISSSRFAEARQFAEQALSIKEQLDIVDEVELNILAAIADLEGDGQLSLNYRARAHEIFAANPANRYQVDQRYHDLIAAIAAAARGVTKAKEEVRKRLSNMGLQGLALYSSVNMLWRGLRDWHLASLMLENEDALLILRVLETLEATAESETLEQAIASLPPTILTAIQQNDPTAFEQVYELLSPREQQRVLKILQRLQEEE